MKLPKLNMKNLLDSFKTRSFRVGGYSIATTAIKMNFKFFITMLLIKKKVGLSYLYCKDNKCFQISAKNSIFAH